MRARENRIETVHTMKKDIILDAAFELIAKDGFNVRLEDIADKAGFSKASLYHYFPDREAIVLEMIQREQKDLFERCNGIVSADMPFRETLANLIRQVANKYHKHVQLSRTLGDLTGSGLTLLAGMMVKHGAMFKRAQRMNYRMHALVRRVVERAGAAGDFTAPLDPDVTCVYITSIVQGIFFRAYQQQDGTVDIESEIRKLFIFLGPWLPGSKPAA